MITVKQGPENLVPTAQEAKPDVAADQAQFRTRLVDGGILNEYLIREGMRSPRINCFLALICFIGAGYLTTEEEKAENDRRYFLSHMLRLFI